jgi:hypothetical protein
MFITIIVLILATIYFIKSYHSILNKYTFDQDTFSQTGYPYNPSIQTPQSNYDKIISQIDSQQVYKSDLSVALGPTPTIKCPELKTKSDCNKYGCNWFGTFCSSTYPTQF